MKHLNNFQRFLKESKDMVENDSTISNPTNLDEERYFKREFFNRLYRWQKDWFKDISPAQKEKIDEISRSFQKISNTPELGRGYIKFFFSKALKYKSLDSLIKASLDFIETASKMTDTELNFHDIDSLCKKYGIRNYTINDGFVDVDGDVGLENKLLKTIPIKFGKVSGNFDCSCNKLTSLEGCPKDVGGHFRCDNNQLTSLEGCPERVGGDFVCCYNQLTSLEGCPKEVGGDFWCSDNQLTSLEVGPKEVGGNFNCSGNKLTSLEGCPKEVGGWFNCSGNKLTSLEGCPKEVAGNFSCSSNKLTSLKGCPNKIGGDFRCSYNLLTIIDYLPEWIEGDINLINNRIRDIKVKDKNYRFFGECLLKGNPINDLFQYWEGDLKNFILDLEIEDFIRDDGKSVDMLRFEYALNGKKYKEEDIKRNYKLIYIYKKEL